MKTYFSSLQSIFIMAVILFWLVPFIQDILPKKDAGEILQACVWLINTLFCAVVGYLYGKGQGKNWYLPLGLMLIFLPLPFLFYPISTLSVLLFYGVASIAGMLIGNRFYKRSL